MKPNIANLRELTQNYSELLRTTQNYTQLHPQPRHCLHCFGSLRSLRSLNKQADADDAVYPEGLGDTRLGLVGLAGGPLLARTQREQNRSMIRVTHSGVTWPSVTAGGPAQCLTGDRGEDVDDARLGQGDRLPCKPGDVVLVTNRPSEGPR
jgi:hypothetical protein